MKICNICSWFTDNEDGTVTDNLTGLMWTKDTEQIPDAKLWQDALTACNDLDYTVNIINSIDNPSFRRYFMLCWSK